MSNKMRYRVLIFASILLTCAAYPQQGLWTQFRGNKLNCISESKTVPVNWSETENIAWKSTVPGKGWSSPVIFDNLVWLTASEEEGKKLFALSFDLRTGKAQKKILLFEPESIKRKHDLNSYATPTPCLEKNMAWFHFGTYGTACINTSTSEILWKRTDLNCDHIQGPGSSPVIYKNLLILHLEGSDIQYIVALDKLTGKTVWKKDRPKEIYEKLKPIGRKAYITPIIINFRGRDLLISNGSAACIAYDPLTGEEIWRVVQGEDSTISMAFYENGLVYFHTGFVTPENGPEYSEILAVDPSGTGDVTRSKIKWRMTVPTLQLLTPVIKNGLIYTVDTKNNIQCIDAVSGKTVWTNKLSENYNSSPIWINGLIYFTSVSGETTVLKEGRKYEQVAVNSLKGETYATAAVAGDSFILRSGSSLYCIRNKKK